MTTISASQDFKTFNVEQGEETNHLQASFLQGQEMIATSNGSLIRAICDAGRVEFSPIFLNDGEIITGSQKDKTSDQIKFKKPLEWVIVSHYNSKFIA